MNTSLRNRLETEIRRMGDALIRDADWSERLPWETLAMDASKHFSWNRSESLYSGASGIALFLLELGRYTDEQRFTDAAERAMVSIVEHCRTTPSKTYAFITGRMSISFAALRFFERTGKQMYLNAALELAKHCTEFLSPHTPDDFINGTSGTLLGLLLLHEASGEAWLLEAADTYINHLINKAQCGKQGLYWDRNHQQIRGLCGFSHGAAGVGFVFAEAARYLDTAALSYIAEQAYLYEEPYYYANVGNWADFRIGIYSQQDQEQHEQEYRSGNMEFFTTSSTMNAWCHGAAGIGLSRLRATQLLPNTIYATEAKNAIAANYTTNVASQSIEGNFSLCHGGGGNADVFIEAYRLWSEKQYLEYAERIAEMALEQYDAQKSYRSGFGFAAPELEDRSLFMGSAGVGYFYLRLLDPMNTPSVLSPTLTKIAKQFSKTSQQVLVPNLGITLPKLRRNILAKYFARTLSVLEQEAEKALQSYLLQDTNNRNNECAEFLSLVQTLLPSLQPEAQLRIKSVLHIEETRYRLDTNIESAAYLFIRRQIEYKRAKEVLESADFSNKYLQLDTDVRLIETSDTTTLLYAYATGVTEQELSPFHAVVVSAFTEPCMVSTAFDYIADQIEYEEHEREQTFEAIRNQIHQFFLAGVLCLK